MAMSPKGLALSPSSSSDSSGICHSNFSHFIVRVWFYNLSKTHLDMTQPI